jgi:hypothetical protein
MLLGMPEHVVSINIAPCRTANLATLRSRGLGYKLMCFERIVKCYPVSLQEPVSMRGRRLASGPTQAPANISSGSDHCAKQSGIVDVRVAVRHVGVPGVLV